MMTLFSQERLDQFKYDEAIAEGEARGETKTFWQLVQDKIITKAVAAKKMEVTVAQFDKMCEEYAFAK